MAWNFYRVLNHTVFTVLFVILFCLVILTPADAIYQCYITSRLTNIFIITGGYVVTILLAALIYATRIYTNRTVLSGIPKAWIPIEKEDVGKGVRRLVMEGLARSAIVAYQARPRDMAADGNRFDDYPMLVVDRDHPPWEHVEHPGWSSPSSTDLPDLPYKTVIQELPNLIEAKAVSLAPPDPLFAFNHASSSADVDPAPPDTRVVEVMRRPASMGLREYLQHLAGLDMLHPPEIGAEFLALYERARFSAHELYEHEFHQLMHVFAELLRGMKLEDPQILGTVGDDSSRGASESIIGPSDEEGETDTMDFHDDSEALSRGRSHSRQISNASTWEAHSLYSTPPKPRLNPRLQEPHRTLAVPQTPSLRSLRPMRSNTSESSEGSVIRLVEPQGPGDLPYTINFNPNGRPYGQ
ncbi:hypothetical protein EYZ11_010682 [Aspergillus tanneri]|uniref:Defect at low temperature protein 1 n=1 Tax=Aspergillus tanneri TaxID=1220188 RepID=A0A4S3J4P7_9EURO|nr:uncharacterized protein ATNIH1004_004582 [Aspergillus tanneri]KAA8648697.1 hypothetical protein ATNIH1004_004582 [Aspergillus tanneri]THC89853.1 hypothetical protein EYZ11_010682 [Aspergillus tanneri]